MTTDNKPPMFGPSGIIDPATYEPRSGRTVWMTTTDVSSLAVKDGAAHTIIGNCTTSLPFDFQFDSKDNGHGVMLSTTREGMSGMLPVTAHENDEQRESDAREDAPVTVHIVDPGPCNAQTSLQFWESLTPDERDSITEASREDPSWLNPFRSKGKA